MDDNVIFLQESKGKKKKYNILFTFEDDENNNYIVYTDNKKDSDGFIKTYAGIYNDDKLLPIENDEIWQCIEKILDKMDKEE